jgi:aminomethyltransferase
MGGSPTSLARLAVRGGGERLLSLKAGDRVVVRDPQGLQPALLVSPAPDRLRFETGVAAADDAALNPDWLIPLDDVVPASAPAAIMVLGSGAAPGAEARFSATADTQCRLVAPGAATTPHEQAVPTDLDVYIDTQGRAQGWGGAPLAAAKADILIKAGTAQAYRVSAGDYIQILDVEGRQCSDFLAFDAHALAQGRERGLDPTVTRTLMGHASPTPGLHAKYFDADLTPLVEIVQDTVGRHDTFLLACTAKYYADAGYPGHDNCSDNFNAAVAPYGVAPRKGWPAINFFYNTTATQAGDIVFDEPWSRPGDYVLLRALTDLVCASSSCADDIDPANGWNPTDIRVRIYDQSCHFTSGRATRMTPDAEPRLTRQSAFHDRTAALTRNFVEYKGYWAPTCYAGAGPIAEYWACREKAVLIDLSALRKFEVIGPDSERLMQLALTRDIRKLAVGQVVYSALCHEHGGMIDDGTVFRLGQDNFRWICGDDYCGVWLRELAERHGLKAWVKSSSDHLHNLAVQGPLSRELLSDLVVTPPHQPSLTELKWFRFTIGRLAGAPVLISRTGYTGELGYEVWCHPKDGPAIWDAIWAAGAPKGMLPMGLSGLDMVRIEAGLIFAEFEFDDQTDPFEAGIGFSAPASKTDPFIGSEALARRRAAPQRRLVGLESDTTESLGHGDPVCIGRARVGVVTSAMRSPLLGKTIALARLDVAHAALGAAVEVGKLDGQQKRISARVTRFPHYDPEKVRVRA